MMVAICRSQRACRASAGRRGGVPAHVDAAELQLLDAHADLMQLRQFGGQHDTCTFNTTGALVILRVRGARDGTATAPGQAPPPPPPHATDLECPAPSIPCRSLAETSSSCGDRTDMLWNEPSVTRPQPARRRDEHAGRIQRVPILSAFCVRVPRVAFFCPVRAVPGPDTRRIPCAARLNEAGVPRRTQSSASTRRHPL